MSEARHRAWPSLFVALLLLIPALSLLPAPRAVAESPSYTITDLGTSTRARSLNDAGQVLLDNDVSGVSQYHAYLWTDGTQTEITPPAGAVIFGDDLRLNASGQVACVTQYDYMEQLCTWNSKQGGTNLGGLSLAESTSPSSINDTGQIVGISSSVIPAPPFAHAFLWTKGGDLGPAYNPQMQDLGTLGGLTSAATGINNQGIVIGNSDLPGNQARHAFLWDGEMHDLGTLGGTQSSANSVNDASEVVGSATIAGNVTSHAVLWQPGMPPKDLDTFASTYSTAWKITNNHQVIGRWTDQNGNWHAFLWDAQSGSVDLGSLNKSDTTASDINGNGQIVGESIIAPQNPHAFIWANGTMADLNDLIAPGSGWTLNDAIAINDSGVILGQGILNGTPHAFLLTPASVAPVVTSLSQTAGPEKGGVTVTITGSGFTGVTGVSFGDTAATNVHFISDTQITATSPEHAAGKVDVTVTTPGGTSAVSTADQFTYLRPLIFIPGIAGSQLVANSSGAPLVTTSDGLISVFPYTQGQQVWLDLGELAVNPEYFDLLRFNDVDGTPVPLYNDFDPNGQLLDPKPLGIDAGVGYPGLISYYTSQGYQPGTDFFVYSYDWRYGVNQGQDGSYLDKDGNPAQGTLADLVQYAEEQSGSSQVDVATHSMGALVAENFFENETHQSDVDHLVMIAPPNLGTVKGSTAAIDGVFVGKSYLDVPLIGIPPSVLQYIYRTLPGALDLGVPDATSTAYQQATGLAPFVNQTSSSDSSLEGIEAQNGASAAGISLADQFHKDDLTWINTAQQAGADVSIIASDSEPTDSQIVEKYHLQLGSVRLFPYYDIRQGMGDDTVLDSAATYGNGALAGVKIYYYAGQHETLATNPQVMAQVVALLQGQTAQFADASIVPAATGYAVEVTSAMELQVVDSAGHSEGGQNPAALTDDLPGAGYQSVLGSKLVTLDHADQYTIHLYGTADGEGLVQLQTITQAGATENIVFPHVPTSPTSTGTLTFDANAGTASDLVVDVKGDGTDMVTVHPTTLTGAAANDVTPPTLTLDAPAQGQAVVGTFKLHWTATDTDSGVADSLAVIDAATAKQIVNTPGPITLTPGQHTVDFYGDDHAGNAAHQQATLQADAYQWLSPLQADGSFSGQASRTIPVKFTVTTPDGQFVNDASVLVDLVDSQGNVVVPALQLSQSPSQGVVVQGSQYHANLSTSGVASGQYSIRVRFNSAQLVGSFTIPVILK